MATIDANGLRPKDAHEAAEALESLLLRQVLKSSGAFHGQSGVAGSETRADLFVEAMADAVSRAGGIGLAHQIEQQIAPPPHPTAAPSLPGLAPRQHDVHAAPEGEASPLLPVSGQISSGFGLRTDPIHGHHTMHRGLDVAAPEGAEIKAAAGGVVKQAGLRGAYGLAVEIEHEDGTTTLYAHCSQISVKTGEKVEPGALVGKVGHTGRATGDHLHFEVREAGRAIDPFRALKAYGGRADMPE